MDKLGLKMAVSKTANTVDEALDIAENLIGKYPIIIRPAFTLGGTGGGIAYNQDELVDIVTGGLDASMTNQVRILKQQAKAHSPDTHASLSNPTSTITAAPMRHKPQKCLPAAPVRAITSDITRSDAWE